MTEPRDRAAAVGRSAASGPDRRPSCVLAIETSWRVGSVALAIEGVVAARRFLPRQREHGARLVPAVSEVLDEAGAALGDLDAVVAGAGPGSFTGVRTGAAVAKALAAALSVPLHAASSLAAAAAAPEALGPEPDLPPEFPCARPPPSPRPPRPSEFPRERTGAGKRGPARDTSRRQGPDIRYVLFDARGGRVYGACYHAGDSGLAEAVAPHGGTIVDLVNSRPPSGTVFAGAGAVAHERLLRAAGHAVAPPPAGFPVADALLLCCHWTPVSIADWEPDYVREWRPG